MHIKFELPHTRVVKSIDHKGNPVAYLEALGIPVLYASPDRPGESTVDGMSLDGWEDVFRTRLAGVLADLLLAGGGLDGWTPDSPTGREVHPMDTVELTREDTP